MKHISNFDDVNFIVALVMLIYHDMCVMCSWHQQWNSAVPLKHIFRTANMSWMMSVVFNEMQSNQTQFPIKCA